MRASVVPEAQGIGLAITQQVTPLHGGRVTASNAAPHDLVIEFELPCRAPKQMSSVS